MLNKKLNERRKTTFQLPRGWFLFYVLIVCFLIMVIPGLIGLLDGLPYWALGIMIVGYFAVSFICYEAGRETVIFDDNTQTIYLKVSSSVSSPICVHILRESKHQNTIHIVIAPHSQKHYHWNVQMELGSYQTFQECKENKGLRFHFSDDKHAVECYCKLGSVADREKFAEKINEYWRKRQRFNEWSKRKKVEMVIQFAPSSVRPVPSKSYDSDPFNEEDPGTGNSEGNIRIRDNGSKYEQTQAVCGWMVNTVKLPQYTDLLIENGFDSLEMFLNLNIEDLKMMGILKLGHQKKILAEVRKLEEEPSVLSHVVVPSISYSQCSPQQSVDESIESGPPPAFLEGM